MTHLHGCLTTYTHRQNGRAHMERTGSLSPTVHACCQLLLLVPYKEQVCPVSRVTGWPWWLDRPFYKWSITGFSGPFSKCPWAKKNTDLLPSQSCSSQLWAFMYVLPQRAEKYTTQMAVWNMAFLVTNIQNLVWCVFFSIFDYVHVFIQRTTQKPSSVIYHCFQNNMTVILPATDILDQLHCAAAVWSRFGLKYPNIIYST